MSFRIFAKRSRKQDMMLLSGWLFADLLLGLMAIFMAAMPPRTPVPPRLTVDPTVLSPQDKQHCRGDANVPICTITLRETTTSEEPVKWTARSDMDDSGTTTVQFSPATGSLSPGQSISITIANFPCQNGSFTFDATTNGLSAITPAVISWQCKATQVKLEADAVAFTLKVNDVPGLLNNSSQEDENIKQQLRSQPLLQNRSVGLAIVYGGTGSDDNRPQAVQIASAIYRIMGSMQSDTRFTAFQRASYYGALLYLGRDPSIVTIDVYRYLQ
jgi:hypothetical protein